MRVFVVTLSLLVASFAAAQTPAQPPPTDTVAPNIPGVVAAGTPVKVIKSGFNGSEGPISLPDGSLIFTEQPASRITRIDKDGNASAFLENTNGSNSLVFDPKGRLISVQNNPGKTAVGVIYPKGSETVLADGYDGRPFVRPNDITGDKKGGVYFSEPGLFGPPPASVPGSTLPPLPRAVYYIPPGGKVVQVADGIGYPNGMQLTPDEKTFYVNDTWGEYLLAFDVRPDGTLTNRRNFGKYQGSTTGPLGTAISGADGLLIDSMGRLYSATAAGVEVFSAKGEHLGTIPFSKQPQNLSFAGPGRKILYVVGRGSVFNVQMLSQGVPGRAK